MTFIAQYGDLMAITLLMVAVGSALAIVLRGFQHRHWKRNLLSIAGILLCSLLAWASIHFLRSTPGFQNPPSTSEDR